MGVGDRHSDAGAQAVHRGPAKLQLSTPLSSNPRVRQCWPGSPHCLKHFVSSLLQQPYYEVHPCISVLRGEKRGTKR